MDLRRSLNVFNTKSETGIHVPLFRQIFLWSQQLFTYELDPFDYFGPIVKG